MVVLTEKKNPDATADAGQANLAMSIAEASTYLHPFKGRLRLADFTQLLIPPS